MDVQQQHPRLARLERRQDLRQVRDVLNRELLLAGFGEDVPDEADVLLIVVRDAVQAVYP
jgi:hypothetical protein